MISHDFQETYEAVIAMQQLLAGCGVREPMAYDGNLIQHAESFAGAVLLECSKDRVAQLTQEQPEQASAFLSVLGDVQKELSSVCVAPESQVSEASKINLLSAEAVIFAARARRRRDEGYSGSFLGFPKDD